MKSQEKLKAVIFGSSGLTGRFLTELLLKDNRYEQLTLFVRREVKVYHGKIRQIKFEPGKIEQISSEISGDQVFCCLGTTIKKAGTKESFFDTDHNLIVDIAKSSSKNRIPVFTVISSVGANPESRSFYLKTKGLTERALQIFEFECLNIMRPSMLLGLRHERRPVEEVGKVIFNSLGFLMIGSLKKYRPIHAETVAKAMISAANKYKGINILESDKIEVLGTDS
ncbi:MAG: NAD(P)H-binding protein [Bacteroidota bacterium]